MPANPTDAANALSSDQISSPLWPSSMRSTPVWHIEGPPAVAKALWQLVPAGAPARSSPDTKTTTGASSSSILPSQLLSWTRPTVGVDHTSV